jgi:hypothetical protein
MASENRDWGYERIVGALANLGYVISDQTVGNILHRHALPQAPERKRMTTWPDFIRTHLALLAGPDVFTAEVLTLRGLVTSYVLFSSVWRAAGSTSPASPFTRTSRGCGSLPGTPPWRDAAPCATRYLLHDRDTKYTQSFRAIVASGRIEPLVLPARSPNLNERRQPQQVFDAEARAPSRRSHERIRRRYARPCCRQVSKLTLVITIADAVFSPREVVVYQRELAPVQGMKGMRNQEGLRPIKQYGCS